MDIQETGFLSLLPGLHNNEAYFDALARDPHMGRRIFRMALFITALTAFYGIIMGLYSGWLQALTAAVKVPVMFFLSLLVCFPAFFLIQYILGSRMGLSLMTGIILSGFVLAGAIMVSFTPVVVFFILTGGDYHFLQLMHVAVFSLSGVFGMKMVLDALRYSCEQKGVYPHMGVVVFRFWVVILAFVGIQLAWNLRPFMAERGEPYGLFRKYEGNFYSAVIYSVEQLFGQPERPAAAPRPENRGIDTTRWVR